MPFITLVHGPYEANGLIKHRPQRLHGLLECLKSKGYEVKLAESGHLNRLTVEMKERTIFQCDIRNLLFNMSCEDDIVCQRIMSAVGEAAARFYSDKNVPLFVSVKEGKRYVQLMDKFKGEGLKFDVEGWYKSSLRKGRRKSETIEEAKIAGELETMKDEEAVEEAHELIDEIIKEDVDGEPQELQEKVSSEIYEITDYLPEDIELYAKEFDKLRPTMSDLLVKDETYREDELGISDKFDFEAEGGEIDDEMYEITSYLSDIRKETVDSPLTRNGEAEDAEIDEMHRITSYLNNTHKKPVGLPLTENDEAFRRSIDFENINDGLDLVEIIADQKVQLRKEQAEPEIVPEAAQPNSEKNFSATRIELETSPPNNVISDTL